MTDKPTRGRPLSPRTLRDMALDDNADATHELEAITHLSAEIQRRAAVAHTFMARGYHRIVGAQEHEDRDHAKPWTGEERRGRTERRREMGVAA